MTAASTEAHIFIQQLGDEATCIGLVDYITATHGFKAELISGNIVLIMPIAKTAEFWNAVASDPQLNWIEYSVQIAA